MDEKALIKKQEALKLEFENLSNQVAQSREGLLEAERQLLRIQGAHDVISELLKKEETDEPKSK